MADALFHRTDDGSLQPSPLTRGPWSADSQHGGAPAALLATELERQVPSEETMQVARLTLELLRPVPLTPLTVGFRMLRPGRKVQLVEGTIFAGDTLVVRALALRIRLADLDELGGHEPPEVSPAPVPGSPRADQFEGMAATWEGFHNKAMDLRFVEGSFGEMGSATAWFRLTVPVVDDEEPTAMARLAAAADFGNGISRVFDSAEALFINPDLTIHVVRPPEGEWVALRSSTTTGPHGIGMAESALFDERGRIGRAVQSLLLDRR